MRTETPKLLKTLKRKLSHPLKEKISCRNVDGNTETKDWTECLKKWKLIKRYNAIPASHNAAATAVLVLS